MSVTGYLVLLTRQVICEEFSQCFNDVNICLWTNVTDHMTDASSYDVGKHQSEAEAICRQRNSFLPRLTNSNVESKIAEFRSGWHLIRWSNFWIDVKADYNSDWQWIDGSPLAGLLVCL